MNNGINRGTENGKRGEVSEETVALRRWRSETQKRVYRLS